jgi:SAM-dependent methyltransferase
MPDSPTANNVSLLVRVPRCFFKNQPKNWHQRRRHRCVLKLLRPLNGKVLDYGCGYGDLTYAMSATHPAEGADVDTDRITFAREQHPELSFQLCTIDKLPHPDESFDIVVSMVVIHFVPDPVQHIREARRVLKKNGRLILGCQSPPYVRDFLRRLAGRGPSPTTPSNLWIRSRTVISGLLEQEGFVQEGSGWFYDPPFARCRSPMAVVVDLINLALCLLRVRKTSTYFALLARRTR